MIETLQEKQCWKQPLQYSFKHWLPSTLRDLDCSFQQSFTRGITARKNAKSFWACFRQELNFQSPSFSAVFPPFSAVFCPLNFPDNIFCRIPFRRLLEKCCKCQNATNNSSEIAFCGAMTVSLTHSATQTPCPQCWMMIYTIAMWNRIYQGKAFAGIETKTSSAIYPS